MNVFTSQNVVWNLLAIDAILTAVKSGGAGTGLTGSFVRLFNNNIGPTPLDTLATYTETVFSGYVHSVATATGPVNLSPAVGGLLIQANFVAQAANPFAPDTVHGWYMDWGGLLCASERFPQPIAIAMPGDFLQLTAILPLAYYQATQ